MKTKLLIVILSFIISGICYGETKERNYVIMLSMDGFRWDYPDRYNTPNLDMIAKKGVKAKALIPSFPSKTFPNHYSIVTGLVPDEHGIIANKFYHRRLDQYFRLSDRAAVENPEFYGGEPIWVTAENQGVMSASYYWPGSETKVKGVQPSIWKKYDDSVPFPNRIDSVVSWLQRPYSERPKLITFYVDEPDGSGHHNGPESEETRKVVEYLDEMLGDFVSKLSGLHIKDSIDLIIISDHGMGELSRNKHVVLSKYLNNKDIKYEYGSNPIWFVEAMVDKIDEVQSSLQEVDGIKVWRRSEVPEYLNFGTNENITNLVVLADSAWGVSWKSPVGYSKGTHGYDPQNSDMHTIFYAFGPDFKEGYVHPSFKNTNVYVLLAELLNIIPSATSGDLKKVDGLLKR